MSSKIVAKMYRMGMLSDVREFVEKLPFKIVEEQVDHCVYAGAGEISTGIQKFQTLVRILKKDSGLVVIVSSKEAGVNEEIPFDTKSQREAANDSVNLVLKKFLN